MRHALLPALFLCLLGIQAHADVFFIEDGSVYIGKVVSADKNEVTLDTFGRTVMLAPGAILRSEADMAKVQALPLEVRLKEGSLFRGSIQDYDPDIGLLLDVGFGTLTIPVANLKDIQDPAQRSRFIGAAALVGLTAEYYFPLGTFAGSFGSGFSFSLFAEYNLQLVRGLSVGLEATQLLMSYLSSTEVSYTATVLTLSPTYRLLFLRSTSIPFLMDLVPWVSAGGGVAYVGVQDRRTGAYQAYYGEPDPAWCASLGIDYMLGEKFVIRLNGRWLALQQSADLLHMVAVRLGAAYTF